MNLIRQDKILYPLILSLFCLIGFLFFIEVYPLCFTYILISIAETAFIVLPFVLLPGKWRWLSFIGILLFLTTVFLNLIYYRNFEGTIPLEFILLWKSAGDTLVVQCFIDSIRFSDYVLLAVIICFIVLWIRKRKQIFSIKYSAKTKGISILCVLGLFVIETGKLINNVKLDSNDTLKNSITHFFNNSYYTNVVYNGYIWNYNYSLYRLIIPKTMSNEEKKFAEYVINRNIEPLDEDLHSMFMKNENKNVIFLIIESLNNTILNKTINGIRIMPNLDSLISLHSSVSFTNVYTQIGKGGSSDGHTIFTSGLMGDKHNSIIVNDHKTNLPSLVRILNKKYSFECIPEEPDIWYHKESNKIFGYDTLYSQLCPKLRQSRVNLDEEIFSKSFDIISKSKQPFFAFVTSLTTHAPYEQLWITSTTGISETKDIDNRDKVYYERCHYTDKQIGIFLNRLKQVNLYYNSVIIIAADHNAKDLYLSDNVNTKLIPVIILNASDKCIKIDRIIGQVDIYPTLLDILGCKLETAKWKGLGESAFRCDNRCVVDIDGNSVGENNDPEEIARYKELYKLSFRLVETKYFKDHPELLN